MTRSDHVQVCPHVDTRIRVCHNSQCAQQADSPVAKHFPSPGADARVGVSEPTLADLGTISTDSITVMMGTSGQYKAR